jgi:hypothetical protein
MYQYDIDQSHIYVRILELLFLMIDVFVLIRNNPVRKCKNNVRDFFARFQFVSFAKGIRLIPLVSRGKTQDLVVTSSL